MTGGLLRRARKVISRGGSSSRGESSRASETPSTPVHPDSQDDNSYSGIQQPPRQSFHGSTEHTTRSDEGIWLTDEQGVPIRRRGRTTCVDIQSLPPGTRVHIEVNANCVPCNITESILLGSYIGVVARDPMLAPISFSDWRNKGLEPLKKKMLAEIESKFEIPKQARHWVLQSLGAKWRNHKASLKAEHWDSRPIEEILETVPDGVDATQWYQLVNQWSRPQDRERAAKNSENAKKQTCPHTLGRTSSVRRQQETSIHDRLQLWRNSRMHKDGSWSSEDAQLRWIKACELLAEEGLTPEDRNIEANERVFAIVMGPEHSGRVRTQGFGVTPNRYFPQSSTTTGEGSGGSSFARFARLEEEMHSVRSELRDVHSLGSEMREYMRELRTHYPPPGSSNSRRNDRSSED